MIHTITGKARMQGLQFTPEQLEPIGIRPGGTAWGVLVDSANLDGRADLSAADNKFNNQSVHMVVSPLHPDRWLTCFRLQVLVERKSVNPAHPEAWTSVTHGLFDALTRVGVNVLDSSKGLIGYDAVSLTAMCEFPDLREIACGEMLDVDRCAKALASRRPASPTDPTIAGDVANLMLMRVRAFKKIGAMLVQRLALLQAQLMLIDELRYLYQNHPAFRKHLGQPDRDSPLRAIIGDSGNWSSDDPYGLGESWFLNRKIIDLGENPFFLNTPEQWGETEGSGSQGPFPQDEAQTGSISIQTDDVFALLLRLLQSEDRQSLRKQKPLTAEPCVSWFWSRLLDKKKMKDTRALREAITKGVLSRAFTSPIRLFPVPTLGHSRAWALPIQVPLTGNAESYEHRFEFCYKDGLLRPTIPGRAEGEDSAFSSDRLGPEDRMTDIYLALNAWSRLKDKPSNSERIDFRASAVAAVHTPDRFLRVRLVRHSTTSMWCRLEVPFKTKNLKASSSSRGVLTYFTSILAKAGFRIEDVNVRYDAIDAASERGRIILVLQAASKEGVERLENDKLRPFVQEQVDVYMPLKDLVDIGRVSCELGVQ